MATLCELTVMAKKNPAISAEVFHKQFVFFFKFVYAQVLILILYSWSETHPKLLLSIPIVKQKIINYYQVRTSGSIKTTIDVQILTWHFNLGSR